MARSYPSDVLVLDSEALIHARIVRGKRGLTIQQAKSYRLPADTFEAGVVTPQLGNEAALADVLRRLKLETGRWDKASLRLPYEVLSRGAQVKVLVLSAVEKTLVDLERLFGTAGIDLVLIEPIGLNIWNAITFREPATTRDRLFFYVRERDFTTAAFRGAQPLFIRSRNLNGERSLAQEIKLSASYLRDTLQTAEIENCYLVGNDVDTWYRYQHDTKTTREEIAALQGQAELEQKKLQASEQRLRGINVALMS